MSDFSEYQAKLIKAAKEGKPSVRVEEIEDKYGPYYHVTNYDAANTPIVRSIRRKNGVFVCVV